MESGQFVTSATLAKILRVSPRRIEQLANDGIVVRVDRGRYDLQESVGRYCDGLRATAETATSSASAELQQERLKTIRMRNAERERQLISTVEAVDVVERLTGSFVATLGGLPAQITQAIMSNSDQRKITKARREIEAVLDSVRLGLVDELSDIEGQLVTRETK